MEMKKYIFVTVEGTIYQPESETEMPDIENLQIVGYGNGNSPEDAVKNMLKENEYLEKTNFDEVIEIEIKSDKRTYHCLREFCKN